MEVCNNFLADGTLDVWRCVQVHLPFNLIYDRNTHNCHTAVGNSKKKKKIFYHSTCWTEQICLRIWKVNSGNTLHFSQRQRKDERWWITYCTESQRLVEQGLDRKWCHEYISFYLTRIWSLAIKLQPEHLKLLSCSQARPENNLITHQPSQQGAKWRENSL